MLKRSLIALALLAVLCAATAQAEDKVPAANNDDTPENY